MKKMSLELARKINSIEKERQKLILEIKEDDICEPFWFDLAKEAKGFLDGYTTKNSKI